MYQASPTDVAQYYDYDQFYPSQTQQISNNYIYDDFTGYYGAQARGIEEQGDHAHHDHHDHHHYEGEDHHHYEQDDHIDRSGYADSEKQTVEEALYIIGKTLLYRTPDCLWKWIQMQVDMKKSRLANIVN